MRLVLLESTFNQYRRKLFKNIVFQSFYYQYPPTDQSYRLLTRSTLVFSTVCNLYIELEAHKDLKVKGSHS